MSTTVQVDRAIADALTAAAERVPIADLEPGPVEVVAEVASALPPTGGRWVSAAFGGARPGRVTVAVTSAEADGLFTARGASRKLATVLEAVTAGLGVDAGAAATGTAPDELPTDLDEPTTITSLALLRDGEHVVTIAVQRAAPSASAGAALAAPDARALKVIRSVEMNVTAELGRSTMTVRELLELAPGSVIELDRAAGSPVDLLVNGTIIARGEVVVIDEEYGIRVSEIIGSPEDL